MAISRDELFLKGWDFVLYSGIFTYLPLEDQDKVLFEMEIKEYAPGENIIIADCASQGVDLILSGEVGVRFPPEARQPALIKKLTPGQIFGERSVLLDTKTCANIQALCRTRTLHLKTATFKRLISEITALNQYVSDLVRIRDKAADLFRLLSIHPLIRNLDSLDIDFLLQACKLREVSKGEQIIRAGDSANELYLVTRGTVSIFAPGSDPHQDIPIAMGSSGYLFGELAILLNRSRAADVFMSEPGELLVIPSSTFTSVLNKNRLIRHRIFDRLPSAIAPAEIEIAQSRNKEILVGLTASENNIGLSTLACGLSAALTAWTQKRINIIDLTENELSRRLNLSIELREVAGVKWREGVLENSGQICLISPSVKTNLADFFDLLRKTGDYTLVLAAPTTQEKPNVLASCDAVVTLSRKWLEESTASEFPAGLKIQATPLYLEKELAPANRIVPKEVRIPRAKEAAELFWSTGDLTVLNQKTQLLAEAYARIARVLIGKSVGLALGGGIAWSFAYIGLIKALSHQKIPIDFIAGSSSGAIIAGLYAAGGMPLLEELFKYEKFLLPQIALASLSTYFIQWAMDQLIGNLPIHQTLIPCYPVASDVNKGTEVILFQGTVGQAVRPACSFPGFFPPAYHQGIRLVDGCVANSVPTSVLWQTGADFIIAGNAIPAHPNFGVEREPVGIINTAISMTVGRLGDLIKSLYILFSQTSYDRASEADYLIDFANNNFSAFDFHRAPEISRWAEETTLTHIPFILKTYKEQLKKYAEE